MDIQDLKHAENILINSTQNNDVKLLIENKVDEWKYHKPDNYGEIIQSVKSLYEGLYQELFQERFDDVNLTALQWIIFDKIHDTFFPHITIKFYEEDLHFFEKCIYLCNINVSAEQFGGDEGFIIPLSASVVELSTLDNYKSPIEKMNCLWRTYDLVFAEIKAALASVISETSEMENEIPIIDNSKIIPILMDVVMKSKLVHMFSNLFYIKSFYFQMDQKHIVFNIFKAFDIAVNNLLKTEEKNMAPTTGKIIHNIDITEYIKITTSSGNNVPGRTLVDNANERILKLIKKCTSDNDLY